MTGMREKAHMLEPARDMGFIDCGNPNEVVKKEKRSKKERKQRPVETAAPEEIRKRRGFPQELGKGEQRTLAFSTVTTGPATVDKQTRQQTGTGTSRRLVETAATEEIRKRRGFPQWLGKASQKTLGFPTVPTSPTAGKITLKFISGGSTLVDPGFCPNNGVHLT